MSSFRKLFRVAMRYGANSAITREAERERERERERGENK
jgi:hypothetical protein